MEFYRKMKSSLQIVANISCMHNTMKNIKYGSLHWIEQTTHLIMLLQSLVPRGAGGSDSVVPRRLPAGRLWYPGADVLQCEEGVGVGLQRQHGRRQRADPRVLLPARLPAQLQPHAAGSVPKIILWVSKWTTESRNNRHLTWSCVLKGLAALFSIFLIVNRSHDQKRLFVHLSVLSNSPTLLWLSVQVHLFLGNVNL